MSICFTVNRKQAHEVINYAQQKLFFGWIILTLAVFASLRCSNDKIPAHHRAAVDNSQNPYTKLRCIAMQDTRLTEGFWKKRFDLAATEMLPTLESTMLGDGKAVTAQVIKENTE